jgi:hypothetical protein
MTSYRGSIVLVLLGVALVAVVGPGQARPSERDVRAITAAKRILVSQLDPKLPRQPLDQWLRRLVGPAARIEWSVDDCGEQTGTPADKGRDFPMCVSASAALPDGRTVGISVQVGTFKKGVRGAPAERMLYLEKGGKLENIPHLSDFPARLRKLRDRAI